MNEELLYCPFCGDEEPRVTMATQYDRQGNPIKGTDTFAVVCSYCGATGAWRDSEEAAIQQWNRRVKHW